MSENPLVSVVVPAYNAEDTICNAIDSILTQTMHNIEIIVVDDGSTDKTWQQIRAIHDPRIHLLRNNRNCGSSAARNEGITIAHGKWIAFLDADDEWLPTRLENLLRVVPNASDHLTGDLWAASIPNHHGRLSPIRTPSFPDSVVVEEFDFAHYIERRISTFPMVTKESLHQNGIQFPAWGSGGEWPYLIARLSACGIKGKLLKQVGCLYRVSGSHDSSRLRAIEQQLAIHMFLTEQPFVPLSTREILLRQASAMKKRRVVAALRDFEWSKFVDYARRSPGGVLEIPGRALGYLWRKLRFRAAPSYSSRQLP